MVILTKPLPTPVVAISCAALYRLQRAKFLLHRMEFRRRRVPYDGWVKLATYYNDHSVRVPVKAAQITKTIRWHAAILEPATGIKATNLSARSLCAGGAMALLAGGFDGSIIKLVAR